MKQSKYLKEAVILTDYIEPILWGILLGTILWIGYLMYFQNWAMNNTKLLIN